VAADFQLLSFVFPAWNEEEMISQTVVAATEAGQELIAQHEVADYEIVLVDDGSSDGTPALIDELAAADTHVRAVHHERNRGLGASVRSGFDAAKGDAILYTDADLPFDLLLLQKAFRLLRIYDADIVSAYRFDRTGEGPRRLVYSYAYNHLIQTMFGLRLRDMNFSFKLCRRSVFDHIELKSEGSFIDVELLARARRLGYEIVQFGVDYFPRSRGVSTLSSNAVIAQLVREMFELRSELESLTPLPVELRRPSEPQEP
jgi:glycosyltransferase involved in cell wall biosynthesis